MSLNTTRSRGRPPSRCSLYRIATLLTPKGSKTTPTIFVKAVNSSNHLAAGNTHLKMCVRPEFIQSDKFYEAIISALNAAKDKSGWQQKSFTIDHAQDRFDCIISGLDSAIETYRAKNANNAYLDPYEDLARELDWTQMGLFQVAKGERTAPRKILEHLSNRVAILAGTDPNQCKIEQLPVQAREYSPMRIEDRGSVMKMHEK